MMRLRATILNLGLLAAALVTGLVMIETGLRWLYPVSMMNIEAPRSQTAAEDLLVPDPDLGIRPALETDFYDRNGILFSRSFYATAPNPRSVLFLGDSVTARGKIVQALAEKSASPSVSFLNGGIGGYNIYQEVEFFFRYQAGIRPDVIVHQLHINDLQPSTLVVRGRDGSIKSYSPRVKPENLNGWLYRYFQIYRFYILQFRSRASQDELRSASLESLRRLRDHARANGIAYRVLLFPVLAPYKNWSAYDKASRDLLLALGQEVGLDMIDLWPLAERWLERGDNPGEHPGDTWHPNEPFADAAAHVILKAGPLLQP